MTPHNRALGAFYGLALGDALGMPTQSLNREQVRARFGAITALVDAHADQPIAPNMPAGSVTDDTEQAILRAARNLALIHRPVQILDQGIEVAQVILPPKELPKILPCSLGDKKTS